MSSLPVAGARAPRTASTRPAAPGRLSLAPRARRSRTRTPFTALVLLLLVGGVAGLLAFNTRMQQASFAITRLETEASSLAAREQKLQLELDQLRDPQRVARAAKRLGMVPPPAPAFIRLSDGRILGDPRPAKAEDAMRIAPPPAAKPRELAPRPRVVEVELTVAEARALERLAQARREARQARRDAAEREMAGREPSGQAGRRP